MAETSKIGAELESVASGGVVAAASAIKDKAKDKYQSEINQEVDQALADRYTKDKVYSKEQTDAKIEAQIVDVTTREKYDTFSATNEDVSIDTILPPVGSEDTIYRVANWDGTEYNTSYWSQYAWKQDTENTGHYVQLAVKNQGLDTTPTPGSLNPVSSGGIADACGHLEESPEYMKVETDAEDKIMHSVSKEDGAYWFHKLKSPTLDIMMEDMQAIKEEAEGEVQQAIEDSQADLAAHYDYYNVSKHHSVRDVVNVYTANEGWEQVEYDSSLAQYDELDIYQVGETCNFGDDTEHSYEATISQRGVAPATIAQEYETRTKFTLEEALAVLPAAVISAFAAGQKICFADLDDFIEEWQITEAGTWERISPYDIKDPEDRTEIKLDAESKIVAYRKADGIWVECVGIEAPNLGDCVEKEEGKGLIDTGFAETVRTEHDPEERLELKLDAESKIVSYRDSDGVLHENVGIKTSKLTLTEDGLNDLGRALKAGGYGNVMDWSDEKFVEIPIPRTCAIVNFGVDSQATSKSDRQDYIEGVNGDIPTTIEFWDKDGNYFKKPILLSAQGASSMTYYIKNQGFDLDDGSKIKFGNWVSQDSFHVKKYYIDIFRGQCIVGYWLTEQMYQTFGYGNIRPWDYLIENNSTKNGLGSANKDFDTGALGHPDGFPVLVFFNGTCNGLYTFNLKKHRDNYYQKKNNTNHIILDGNLAGSTIWGDINTIGIVDWDEFEIRNPKPKKKSDGWDLVDTNGEKYNGDFPTELMGTDTPGYDPTNQSHVKSAATKANILRLAGALKAIGDNPTKETYEQYFNSKFVIDYYLISNVLFHFDGFAKNWIWCTWDGNIWTPTVYDVDSIFGMHWQGGCIIDTYRLGGSENEPTYYMAKDRLYWNEVKARYAELRNKGVFTTENIIGLLRQWLDKCGYNNIKNDIDTYAPQTPSYRENLVNSTYWNFLGYSGRVIGGSGEPYDPTKSDYVQGDRVTYLEYVFEAKGSMPAGTVPSERYSEYPFVGGFYNSIQRVKNWLDINFNSLDTYFEYTNN